MKVIWLDFSDAWIQFFKKCHAGLFTKSVCGHDEACYTLLLLPIFSFSLSLFSFVLWVSLPEISFWTGYMSPKACFSSCFLSSLPDFPFIYLWTLKWSKTALEKLLLSPVAQVHDMHCFLFNRVPRTTYLLLLLPRSALPKDWLL